LTGRAPFDMPILMKLSFDAASERADADAWMRLTFNLPAVTNLNDLGGLASDPRLIRGTELWNLGLYEDARLEFEDLRAASSANAVDSYKLANYLLDLGLYRTASLSPMSTSSVDALFPLPVKLVVISFPPFKIH
jgi:soluble lytic murein transglycosylase